MMQKQRIELIVGEWFELKTGVKLSKETLSKLVDEITEVDSCDAAIVKSSYCECMVPIIRTSVGGGEYCADCELDLDNN